MLVCQDVLHFIIFIFPLHYLAFQGDPGFQGAEGPPGPQGPVVCYLTTLTSKVKAFFPRFSIIFFLLLLTI